MMAYDDEGRDWSDAPTSQEALKDTHKSPEGRHGTWSRFPLTAFRRNQAASTLVLDFQPPDYKTIHFCCLSHPLRATLLQQPQETNAVLILGSRCTGVYVFIIHNFQMYHICYFSCIKQLHNKNKKTKDVIIFITTKSGHVSTINLNGKFQKSFSRQFY